MVILIKINSANILFQILLSSFFMVDYKKIKHDTSIVLFNYNYSVCYKNNGCFFCFFTVLVSTSAVFSHFVVCHEWKKCHPSVSLQVGRLENAIGWYHSHPGYGCWLSGIDVSTQMLNQQFQEPFVAVVVRQRNTFHFSFKAICAIFF